MTFLLKVLAGVVDLTTWNPADKASALTLSADLLTVSRTVAPGPGHVNVRSISPRSSGKRYFEVARGGGVNGSQVNVGLTLSTFVLSGTTQFPGTGNTGAGVGLLYVSGGNAIIAVGGGLLTTQTALANSGDVGRFAIDFGAKLFWAAKVGANWNGDPSANPATGANGIDISSILPASLYITADVPANDGTNATINCGGQPFAGTPPAGFGTWD